MMNALLNHPINDDFIIAPYQHGVSINTPEKSKSLCHYNSLKKLKSLPFNVFILDTESGLRDANDHVVDVYRSDSLSQVLGKKVTDMCEYQFASRVLVTDKAVLQHGSLQILEEAGRLFDDSFIQMISFKYPLYFQENLIGILGFAIPLQCHNVNAFTQSLLSLTNTGLLCQNKLVFANLTNGTLLDGTYYNQHECNLLKYVLRGRTAKEIARELNLSYRTIEHQFERLKLKANCKSRSELIDKAFDWFILG